MEKLRPPKRVCERKPKTCELCGKILTAGTYSLNKHLKNVHKQPQPSKMAESVVQPEESKFQKWKKVLSERFTTDPRV